MHVYRLSVSFYLMGNFESQLAVYYLATIRSDFPKLGLMWASKGPELQRPLNAGVTSMGNDEDQLQTFDEITVCTSKLTLSSQLFAAGRIYLRKTIRSILRYPSSRHPHGRGCEFHVGLSPTLFFFF